MAGSRVWSDVRSEDPVRLRDGLAKSVAQSVDADARDCRGFLPDGQSSPGHTGDDQVDWLALMPVGR